MNTAQDFLKSSTAFKNLYRKNEKIKDFDLRIGVSDEVERPFVADVLGKLVKLHGSKKLSSTIVSGSHQEIVSLLAEDKIDVVISNQKIAHAQPYGELHIPVVLATANIEEPLRLNSATNIQSALEKLGQSLILPMDQMVLGKETRDYLKRQGVKIVTSLQSNILACIVRAVEEGVGSAFLPVAYVNFQVKKGLLRSLGPREGCWQHTLYLYAEKGSTNEFLGDLFKIIQNLMLHMVVGKRREEQRTVARYTFAYGAGKRDL